MYFFVLRPPHITVNVEEEGFAALAHTLEGAQAQLNGYAASKGKKEVSYKVLGQVDVAQIMTQVDVPKALTDPPVALSLTPEAKKLSKEQFLTSLQMTAEELMTDEKDKGKLLTIIEKLRK